VAGFDSAQIRRISEVVSLGLRNTYPGAVFIIGTSKAVSEPICLGYTDQEGAHPVTPDTSYDLASLTKPVATAASLLILIEHAEIRLEQLASDFFALGDAEYLSQVTIKHLLTHTSGLPAHMDLHSKGQTRQEVVSGILAAELSNQPGTTYRYSCLGYILLGIIIEKTAGCGLDEFSAKHLFQPLGMLDTSFRPTQRMLQRVAPTSNLTELEHPQEEVVHDGNAKAMGGVSGNSGLFSTAYDLAIFCSMLLRNDNETLSRTSIDMVFTNLLDSNIGYQTAGWFMSPSGMLPSGDLLPQGTIGHTGFTGTSIVTNRLHDIFAVLLTNRVSNSSDSGAMNMHRRSFHDAVAKEILFCG
jgi:serine-type D-Ala-D-Ala carboxypeptidase